MGYADADVAIGSAGVAIGEAADQQGVETDGVRHLDAERRNITYDRQRGCFCIIDFELAEILPDPAGGEIPGNDEAPSPNA